MRTLENRVVFITGGSRGIGRAIALRCARDGARVAIAAKTSEPHPKLEGTIHTVAAEIDAAGGRALPLQVDVRSEEQIQAAMEKTVETFGGLDILVNNASAISLTPTLETEMKKFDLMFSVNVRGTYACSRAAIPYLKKSANPHILTLSPPLNLSPKWFKNHVAYTMSKYGMSMCTLGMAEELRRDGIAVNSLWPRTAIATAAIEMLLSFAGLEASRTPEIMADAAHAILTRPSREYTGHFALDEEVLAEEGVTDFDKYANKPGTPLLPDFFLD
ncbi:MAG: NAD(P)-dependent oxidoreductase [Thermoanaerobaculia bacterium]|nr:NAD(P)-dependent oxidoreductase [Thermoanaerobaculia bacterium]